MPAPIIINGIYTKDFPPLGRAILSTDIIIIAVAGDPITYRSTASALNDAIGITVTGTTDASGNFDASATGTARLIAVYEGNVLVRPEYNKSTKLLSGMNASTAITAYFI